MDHEGCFLLAYFQSPPVLPNDGESSSHGHSAMALGRFMFEEAGKFLLGKGISQLQSIWGFYRSCCVGICEAGADVGFG